MGRAAGPIVHPANAMDDFVSELTRICGPDRVITHPHALRTYESDGLLQYRAVPRVAVLPDDADEVRRIVAACHAASVPWGYLGVLLALVLTAGVSAATLTLRHVDRSTPEELRDL